VRAAQEQDPIPAFAARLKAAGLLDEQQAEEIDEQVQRAIDAAVKYAEESPNPPVEGLFDSVYAPEDTLVEGTKHG
jgi:TPP-dependent pyruvate/acetoin dehydrogenase alpha subunit